MRATEEIRQTRQFQFGAFTCLPVEGELDVESRVVDLLKLHPVVKFLLVLFQVKVVHAQLADLIV